MAECAHFVCTCDAAEGSEYCSAFCEENPEADECHCHHMTCHAPHHH